MGPYIIRDILSRPATKVIAHIRAKNEDAGRSRIESILQNYGIWSDDWQSRLACVTGDLKEPRLGMSEENWEKVGREADVVIHNGAQVHWVYPCTYEGSTSVFQGVGHCSNLLANNHRSTDDALKAANVLSTLAAMSLCATGKPKTFVFVSSTSVLDTDHYVQMSANGTSVPESDNLEGSRKGLGTGYGQSKWVSEYLVREAGKRGLRGMIVRPGYVLGESESGGMSFPPSIPSNRLHAIGKTWRLTEGIQ